MVKIKTHFSSWRTVTAEQAQRWALKIYEGATNIPAAERVAYINARITGATFSPT